MNLKIRIWTLVIITVFISVVFILIFDFLKSRETKNIKSLRQEQLSRVANGAVEDMEDLSEQILNGLQFYREDILTSASQAPPSELKGLSDLMNSFNIQVMWIYERPYRLQTYYNLIAPSHTAPLSIPTEFLDFVRRKGSSTCYLSLSTGTFLVSGKLIRSLQEASCPKSNEKFILIARKLDPGYTDHFKKLINSEITYSDLLTTDSFPVGRNQIRVVVPLKDWKGNRVQDIIFTRELKSMEYVGLISYYAVIMFFGMGVIAFALYTYFLNKWIFIPIARAKRLINKHIRELPEYEVLDDETTTNLSGLLDFYHQKNKELEQKIADREDADKWLENSEEKFVKTFLFNPTPIILVSVPDWQVVNVNESFLDITHYNLNDLVGKSLENHPLFQYFPVFENIFKEIEREQKAVTTEISVKTRLGGTHYWVLKSDVVFLKGSKSVLSVIFDITEKKQEDAMLEQSEKRLRQSDRLKDLLLINMSHKLRTPLTGIRGFAELITEESGEFHIKQLAEKIMSSSDRLLRSMNTILLATEIQAGKITVRKEKILLNNLLESIVEEFKPRILEKNLVIDLNMDKDVYLMTDEDHLKNILRQLLDNAIKFTDKGRLIIVMFRSSFKSGSFVDISVKDTGVGISNDRLDGLFTEFRLLGEENENKFEGKGLGLSICQYLTRLLDGEISVSSRESSGSEFRLLFTVNE